MLCNIVVLNYSTSHVDIYHANITPRNCDVVQNDDVEEWLCNNTNFKESTCSFLFSFDENEIEIIDHRR